MNLFRLFGTFLICISICSCSNNEATIINLDISKLEISNKLVSLNDYEFIKLDIDTSKKDISSFYLFNDTLVITQNTYKSNSFIDAYSLTTGEILNEFAIKGRGPGEFISCNIIDNFSNNSDIYLVSDNELFLVDLDSSLVENKIHIKQKLNFYNTDLHAYMNILPLDSLSYLGYNMWYTDEVKYNTKHIPMLSKQKFNIDYESVGTNDYFPGNINGATLILNPQNNNIWVADWHKQRIDIIDTALCLIKQIKLPQSKMLNISVRELPHISMLNYDDQLIYKAFAGFTATKDYVYIINENINGVDSDVYENNELQPVEIYQFNWDGELAKVYKLNKYVSNISVSSCGDYLYCTAKDKLYGEPYLIKYKL